MALSMQLLSAECSSAEPDISLGAGLALILDELAHGVIVANAEGLLVHSNQAARHELAHRRVLATHHNMLLACTAEGGKILHEALVKVAQGKRSLIELPAVQGPGLSMVALPLKTHAVRSEARAALLFARGLICDPLMLGFFGRSHRLTCTEEQVLGLLCQGFSAPQIAAQLKVAVSTVRSHVRSLCVKTGSSGVRELVGRVAVLPPLAQPFWQEPVH